ncbi:MAG: hypothetical protein GY738_12895 [Pseudoalteromonas sp.]|nr:hypothetical protein [Pseudoalteromonas sp.]
MTDSSINFRKGNAVDVKAVNNNDGTHSIAVSLASPALEITRTTHDVEYSFNPMPEKRIMTVHGSGGVTIEAFNGLNWTETDRKQAPYGGKLSTSGWNLRFLVDNGATLAIGRALNERVGGGFVSNEGNRFISSEDNYFIGLGT